MSPEYSQSRPGARLRIDVAIVAILVLGLFGCLFHHHESSADFDSCSACHAGVQTPVANLAADLATPFLAAAGFAPPCRARKPLRAARLSTLIPPAPPDPTHPLLPRA